MTKERKERETPLSSRAQRGDPVNKVRTIVRGKLNWIASLRSQ